MKFVIDINSSKELVVEKSMGGILITDGDGEMVFVAKDQIVKLIAAVAQIGGENLVEGV